jgi:hypothetical protein
MNKLKKLYRDFFGLREATTTTTATKANLPSADSIKATNAELEKTVGLMNQLKQESETDLDEAQLLNRIIDYRGGVEYVLRDPAEAKAVAQEISEWATKKGFTIIKQTTSTSGKVGYFYFRLGQDPARESQRIQGYISQKPEIKHFRFKVRNEQPVAKTRPEI